MTSTNEIEYTQCPACDVFTPQEVMVDVQTIIWHGMELMVTNLRHIHCENCGEDWVPIEFQAHNERQYSDAKRLCSCGCFGG